MRLSYLHIGDTKLVSLAPLKGMKLERLFIPRTKVTDFTVLKDMPLKELEFDFSPERSEFLRSHPTLDRINDMPAREFWKKVDEKKP
jgi:hypothetical protein